ncbi:MAG: ribonuclease P protein component [Chitinophagaceae bacterium]
MAKQFTLGKNERLKSRKQIEQLFNDGQRFSISPFRIFYSIQNSHTPVNQHLQTGFGVSSRNFKTAVDRNRIKRLTKEAWRLQKNELGTSIKEQNRKLNVFLIYTGKKLPVYEDVYSSIKQIVLKLLDISNKKQ